MHIEAANNNGTKYLKLARCRRGTNSKGKRTIIKEVILNIGPLSKYDDGKPDFLARLRQSFREGHPLIDALKPYVGSAPKEEWILRFRKGDGKCKGEPKRFAACVLDPVFSALGLDQFFASVKYASKIRYDLQGIVRLLVYGRILEPASKCATMEQNGKFYEPLVKSDNPDNVYDALTVIDENADKIFRRTNTCHVTDAGNGYIVSRSIRKSTAATREWAVSSDGYTVVSDKFRRKSRISSAR